MTALVTVQIFSTGKRAKKNPDTQQMSGFCIATKLTLLFLLYVTFDLHLRLFVAFARAFFFCFC